MRTCCLSSCVSTHNTVLLLHICLTIQHCPPTTYMSCDPHDLQVQITYFYSSNCSWHIGSFIAQDSSVRVWRVLRLHRVLRLQLVKIFTPSSLFVSISSPTFRSGFPIFRDWHRLQSILNWKDGCIFLLQTGIAKVFDWLSHSTCCPRNTSTLAITSRKQSGFVPVMLLPLKFNHGKQEGTCSTGKQIQNTNANTKTNTKYK